jgi:nitrite reductase/ring-hydroxylating ferredoxin subunit
MKHKVARVADVPPGAMLGVLAGGQRLLVANVAGEYYAMNAKCNHLGGPLDRGTLGGSIVICPLHGSQWDVRTGNLVSFSRPLPPERTYPVSVEGDEIVVEV